jgi:hypothetical protein
MTAIIKDSFRTFTVKNVKNSFFPTGEVNSLYLGIGRPYKWDELSDVPPIGEDFINRSLISDLLDHEDLMHLKRIGSTSVSHSIKKRKWIQNTVYDIFRHDWGTGNIHSVNGQIPITISDSAYYVTTELDDVYICIKHPVSFSAGIRSVLPSTQSPDFGVPLPGAPSATHLFQTNDGYIWKYISSTSAFDVGAFSSNDFQPVKNVNTLAPQPSGAYSRQWQSQTDSKSYRGGIYHISINSTGSGYNNGNAGTSIVVDAKNGTTGLNGTGTQVLKVVGDGTGLTFKIVFGSGGSIVDLTVLNPGANYTFAHIVFVGAGSGASLTPILTSPIGLGVSPIDDLVAYNLSIYTILQEGEGVANFTINNEYRKIVLIANPTVFGGYGAAYNLPYATCMWSIQTQTGLTFQEDSELTFSEGATSIPAKFVDYDSSSGLLRVIRTRNQYDSLDSGLDYEATFIQNMTIYFGLDALGTVESVISPDVQPGSGTILYSEYRYPLRRAENQDEEIRLTIEF